MRHRLDRLQARLDALGHCPRCNGQGVEGIRVEHAGLGEHPPPSDPPGCSNCGRVGEVTTLILDHTPIGNPPLPGEPGATYADPN